MFECTANFSCFMCYISMSTSAKQNISPMVEVLKCQSKRLTVQKLWPPVSFMPQRSNLYCRHPTLPNPPTLQLGKVTLHNPPTFLRDVLVASP